MDEFMDLTPAEFGYLVKGWSEQQEQQFRSEWERVRWSTVMIMNPHLKKQIANPKSFMKFEWEKEEVKPLPDDELKRLKAWQ